MDFLIFQMECCQIEWFFTVSEEKIIKENKNEGYYKVKKAEAKHRTA